MHWCQRILPGSTMTLWECLSSDKPAGWMIQWHQLRLVGREKKRNRERERESQIDIRDFMVIFFKRNSCWKTQPWLRAQTLLAFCSDSSLVCKLQPRPCMSLRFDSAAQTKSLSELCVCLRIKDVCFFYAFKWMNEWAKTKTEKKKSLKD